MVVGSPPLLDTLVILSESDPLAPELTADATFLDAFVAGASVSSVVYCLMLAVVSVPATENHKHANIAFRI